GAYAILGGVEVKEDGAAVGRMAGRQPGLAGVDRRKRVARWPAARLDGRAGGRRVGPGGGGRGRRPCCRLCPGPVGGPYAAAPRGPGRVRCWLDLGAGLVRGFGCGVHPVESVAVRANGQPPVGCCPRARGRRRVTGLTQRTTSRDGDSVGRWAAGQGTRRSAGGTPRVAIPWV